MPKSQTRARMCGTKTRHEKRPAADRQLWSLIRAGVAPGAMAVYRCNFRAGWHVGHRGRKRR